MRLHPVARAVRPAYNRHVKPAGNAIAENPARVLVVDDEPGVVSFVARALRGRGFEVDVAGGGDEALAKLGTAL